ncbi:hypothetical protein ACFVSN_40100 [Kitasatospora sp. NPDC057904]|uniref:hypothetical protein n=1 Tax=unclassified Kitasatospora TaxID=2633591 RepID=UPI0036DAB3D5
MGSKDIANGIANDIANDIATGIYQAGIFPPPTWRISSRPGINLHSGTGKERSAFRFPHEK